MTFRSAATVLVLCGCLAVTGCGSGGRAKRAQVSGTVTYNGTPLAQGSIVFLPAEGHGASGKIVDGKITDVVTYDPGDGVPVGKHKVMITSVDNPKADMYTPTKSLIPEKYSNSELTDLTAEIKPGENELTFALKD